MAYELKLEYIDNRKFSKEMEGGMLNSSDVLQP